MREKISCSLENSFKNTAIKIPESHWLELDELRFTSSLSLIKFHYVFYVLAEDL